MVKLTISFKYSCLLTLLTFAGTVCFAQTPELVVQTGHSGSVSTLALSPDGKMLVSGGYDSTIKVWEMATGRELRTLRGHAGSVNSLAFSPDGKMLASGSFDLTIKLWDVATWQTLRTMTGHSYPVFSVDFISEGRTLVSSSGDSTIRTWDVATGKQIQVAPANRGPIAVSTDRKVLAVKNEKTVMLLNASTLEVLSTLSGHSEPISSVVFSKDGRILASSSAKAIKLWEVATGRETLNITREFELAGNLAFSPDGKTLASSVGGRTIHLWNSATGQGIRTLTGHTRPIHSLVLTPDNETLVSSDRGGRIKLWEVSSGRLLRTLGPRAAAVGSAIFTADGKTIVSNVVPGRVKLWGMASVRELLIFARPAERGVPKIAVSPDGKTLATSGDENIIKLWSVSSARDILRFSDATKASAMAFSPDGRLLAVGNYEIKLLDVVTGQTELRIENQKASIDGIAFSTDGTKVASFGYDKWIILNDVASGRAVLTITASSTVRAIAFSPDGQTLASSGTGDAINIWDLKTGRELRSLPSQKDFVETLAYSADGKWLASGSWDSTIRLYDVATGRLSRTLTGHSHHVNSVRFSADTKFLVSGSDDATVRIWRVEDGKLLASLIALDEVDWAVVTPDGRFDASAGAQKLMHWMVGSEPIDLEQLKERYYEPGLLAKVISEQPQRDVSKFENPKLYPDVKVEAPGAGGKTLLVTLTNRGGGIGRVQVFVNGKEFLVDARDAKLQRNPNVGDATLSIDLSKASSIRTGVQDKIRVVAWNVENYISSRGEETVWLAAGPTNKAAPEVYAIIGGISRYAAPRLNLNFAAADAVAMANVLEQGAKRLFGADKVHLTLLTTAQDPRAVAPIKENFTKAFAAARQAKATDIFIVYLAGHAITLQRGTDTYCYLTQEARTTDTSALSDSALRKQVSITSEELVEWIKQIPANKQAIMLDTCAAGAARGVLSLTAMRDASGDAIRAIDRAKDRTGSHILMGSAADAFSYEASQYGQGLLTYALLKGMKGPALRDDQLVDISKLFRFARDEVEQLAKNIGGIQKPLIFAPNDDSFDVGQLNLQDRQRIFLAAPKPMILRPRFLDSQAGDDTIDLMKTVRELLRDETFITARGPTEAALVFVDDEDFPSGIRPTGAYTVEGNKVTLTLRLRRDGVDISTTQLIGTKDSLAAKVMEAIKAAIARL